MQAHPTALEDTLTSSSVRTLAPVRMPLATSRLGRYEIHGLLGEGGMGSVYAAFDPVLERAVAIKVTRRDRSRHDEQSARLLREAVAMARVEHPNVIRVYDAGIDDGEGFLAMELVHGGTLAAWLRAEPRSTKDILAAYVQAGRGLAAAHDAGLVHRDFKPENVLLARDGRVLVTDFGLSRPPAAGGLVEPIIGTPEFMAPEQWAGELVDARADQYSFCLALWQQVRTATRLPPRIRSALRRGLSRDPAQRFATMHELLALLDGSAMSGELSREKPTRSCSVATRPGRVRPLS